MTLNPTQNLRKRLNLTPNDAGPSSTPPDAPIILGDGSMTRARAKKLQRDSFLFVSHALFSSAVQLPESPRKAYMCIGTSVADVRSQLQGV